MTRKFAFLTLALAASLTLALADDHEKIEKVMKEGLKGDTSPMAKVLDGAASDDETKELAKLVKTMSGTKAPQGEQSGYETKVNELIAALDAVAGGDKSEAAIGRLEKAQNCKACHSEHKPK